MKQTFTFLTFIFASLVAFSQAPNTMSYQAVIRDANNNLVSNQSVGMQISILQGSASGSSVYTETQTASTNDNGLVSVAIGEGSTNDNFSSIDWANGPYFIKTETDPAGGSNYTITGTSQLLSVPYVLYSGNGIKSVSNSGDTLFLGNGGFVIIPGLSAANTSAQLATLSTTVASSITAASAVSGGTITNNGGATITARGVVWSTSQNPTLASYLGSTNDGSGTGTFTSNLTGLTASTTYYVRAYATNSAGTAYGNEVSFTTTAGGGGIVTNPGAGVTFDGYTYSSIVLGNGQEWMAENLRTTSYANGDTIPNVTNSNQWQNLTTGAWAHYYNTSQFENPYGKLYNWYTVADSRNVCPTGWHVPSDAEWTLLTDYLGGQSVAGGKMKSTGTQYWESPNQDATNESGFSGLPGGYRYYDGPFYYMGKNGYWWSSTELNTGNAWLRGLGYSNDLVGRGNNFKTFGLSVRCLKD